MCTTQQVYCIYVHSRKSVIWNAVADRCCKNKGILCVGLKNILKMC